MRKSWKCTYKIGVNVKQKKKFLRPEEAMAAADMLNAQENSIKKHVPYKCTTCHFFHIGRSHDDLKRTGPTVFTPRTEVTIPSVAIFGQVEGAVLNEITADISVTTYAYANEEIAMEEKVEELMPTPQKSLELHDDFDWDSDKRIL